MTKPRKLHPFRAGPQIRDVPHFRGAESDVIVRSRRLLNQVSLPVNASNYTTGTLFELLTVHANLGGRLFVLARCIVVRQSLQLLQGLQIELLITALRLS